MASLLEVLQQVPVLCEQYDYDEPQVIISSTMTNVIGRCFINKKLIKLNERFVDNNTIEVVVSLLKHEIAHLKFRGHGNDFIEECHRMGIKHYTYLEHPDANLITGMYIYECPCCKRTSDTNKLYKYDKSCGACSLGKYNEDYKLVRIQ